MVYKRNELVHPLVSLLTGRGRMHGIYIFGISQGGGQNPW